MNRTQNIGRDVFFTLDADIEKAESFLWEKFKIKIIWLLEDGIAFDYPETLKTKNYPGDIGFYDVETDGLILIFIQNFNCLEFLNAEEEVILSIPTLF